MTAALRAAEILAQFLLTVLSSGKGRMLRGAGGAARALLLGFCSCCGLTAPVALWYVLIEVVLWGGLV